MSTRKRSQISFNVPHNREDKVSVNQSYQDLRPWPYGYLQQGSVTLNSKNGHKATPAVTGDHKTARPYVMGAWKATYGSYDHFVGSPAYGRYWGQTDGRLSNGPGDYTKWGLKLAGGYYVPGLSDNSLNQAIAGARNKAQNSDLNLATSLAEAKAAVSDLAKLLVSMAALTVKIAKRYGKHVKPPREASLTADGLARNYTYVQYGKIQYLREHHETLIKAFRDSSKKSSSRPGKIPVPPKGSKWELPDRVVSGAESAWLSAMYGFIPLWMDYQGLVAQAAAGLQKEGAHVDALRVITRNGLLPLNPNPFLFRHWEVNGRYQYGAECQLRYRMKDPHIALVSSLGFTNPFSVWWELTPYSFVFDWLIPVGAWLQALTAEAGLTFVDGYTNEKSFCDFTITCCQRDKAYGKFPNVHIQNVAQVRSQLNVSPIGGLYMKSPFSTIHAVSAIALAAQRMR